MHYEPLISLGFPNQPMVGIRHTYISRFNNRFHKILTKKTHNNFGFGQFFLISNLFEIYFPTQENIFPHQTQPGAMLNSLSGWKQVVSFYTSGYGSWLLSTTVYFYFFNHFWQFSAVQLNIPFKNFHFKLTFILSV